MSETSPPAVLRVPAHDVPVPRHLSPEAQAMLAAPWPEEFSSYPPPDDLDGWRRHIARSDAMMQAIVAPQAEGVDAEVRERHEGEALAYEVVPRGLSPGDRRVYLDVHGGALIMGGGPTCRMTALGMAGKLGVKVVAVDYRMPPDHPYPAGLEDCVAIYRALLREHRPEEIVVGGLSAGGNLAAALILKARDEGAPLPGAAVLLSPELDLTESGDSFRANRGLDVSLRDGLMPANRLYAAGHDLAHPYLSPLFGDFAKGFPPTFLTAGTRDLFLSNAARMQRALRNVGVPAELHLQEGAPHAAFGSWPELAELDREMRRFCEDRWAAAGVQSA